MPERDGLGPDREQQRERKREPKQPTIPQLERAMRETIEAVAGFVVLSGDEYCGAILEERAAPLAAAYAQLASRNRAVRRFLTALTTGSDWGQVIVLTIGTAVPIAAHHGWLPAGSWPLGSFVTPPPSEEVTAHDAAVRGSSAPKSPAAPEPPTSPAREPVPGEEAAEPPPAPPEGNVVDAGGAQEAKPPDAGNGS